MFSVTILVTISIDLLMGVDAGIILELIINLFNGASLKNLFKTNITMMQQGDRFVMMIRGDVVFSNILGLKKMFLNIPAGKDVIIDVSQTAMVDHTSITTLNGLVEDYKEEGGKIKVVGFENHRQLGHAPTSTRLLKLG
ncbi:MAG: STAS domain-containing protein [Bacteroidota bacterium]